MLRILCEHKGVQGRGFQQQHMFDRSMKFRNWWWLQWELRVGGGAASEEDAGKIAVKSKD